MYIILERADEITRDEQGVAISWRGKGQTLGTFTNADKLVEYIKENVADLKDVIAFTGSASQLWQANAIIANELKKAGLLK
jgi:hypothetical protein